MHKIHRLLFIITLACISLMPQQSAHAKNEVIYQTSFEKGTNNIPEGWVPSDGSGLHWENEGHSGNHSISVFNDDREGSATWRSRRLQLKPGQPYRLSFWTKDEGSGHAITSGMRGINHDFRFSGPQWQYRTFVFTAPEQDYTYINLGQYHINGKVYFDDVKLERVIPYYQNINDINMGEGEQIKGNMYSFNAPLYQSGHSRNLTYNTAGFNTNRWVFQKNSQIIYKQQVDEAIQESAKISITVNWYKSGVLLVQASSDGGNNWIEVGKLNNKGMLKKDLPKSLFPSKSVLIRLRSASAEDSKSTYDPGSFQVNNYQYEAQLSQEFASVVGKTHFLALAETDPQVHVDIDSLGNLLPGPNTAKIRVAGARATHLKGRISFWQGNDPSNVQIFKANAKKKDNNAVISLPYHFKKDGSWSAKLEVLQNDNPIYSASTDFYVPSLYDSDYGKRVANNNDIWWSDPAHKVWRNRPMPEESEKSTFVPLELAGNEYEGIQVIAHPDRDVTNVTVKVSDLVSSAGAAIDSKNVTIDEVAYVPIQHLYDHVGAVDNWPDPLPPLRKPITLKANQNQPFWITVFAPKDTPGGVYKGKVLLSGDNWQRKIPLQVTVWDFALSDETHIKTAFGRNFREVGRYHHVSGDNLNKVIDKYYENFAQHRISTYYRTGLDAGFPRINVDWGLTHTSFTQTSGWEGGVLDIEKPLQGKQSLRLDNKNNYNLSASYWRHIPVSKGKNYQLKYSVRATTHGQPYQIKITTYDMDNKEMSDGSFIISKEAATKWRQVTEEISQKLSDPQIRYIKIELQMVSSEINISNSASVWFDEMQILEGDNGSNRDLLNQAGNFEKKRVVVTPDQVKVDFSQMDQLIESQIKKYHINTFRLQNRATGYRNGDTYIPGKIGQYIQGSPEYNILFGSYMKQLQDHLEKKGWLDKAYLYWIDEPPNNIYKDIEEMGRLIQKYAPKVKWMLTINQAQPHLELAEVVDIFNPVSNNYDHKIATQLQKQDKEFWWYLANLRTPYVTEYIDHPGIEQRVWLWQTWKNNIQGVLVWDVNYWRDEKGGSPIYHGKLQNPWNDPVSWSGSGDNWGNGEGRYLYPPRRDANTDKAPNLDGPINSIRWELLRDGIEDYEYLWTLQQQVSKIEKLDAPSDTANKWLTSAKQLLEVPETISKNLTNFTKDPKPIMQHRAEIAEAIISGKKLLQ